jgi:RNA polymerase sigma-70 factor (ECF subfamily)
MQPDTFLNELERMEGTDTIGQEPVSDQRIGSAEVPTFEELFAEYQPLVHGIALRYLGNPEDAEDATQEVFTKVWKNLEAFNCNSSLKTWIYRIAVNTCIDHGRKPWKKLDQRSTGIDDSLEDSEITALIIDDETAERKLIAKEKAAQVRTAITRLKPHLKTVLVLKDLEELSYDEISTQLGLSMGTISSRLNRARRALLELFSPSPQPLPQGS